MAPREVLENSEYDVVVLGGGPSGCTAAAAAARNGARTLLIEATGALGGMGTAGLVPCFAPYGNEGRSAYGGIALRVLGDMMRQIPRYGSLKYGGQNRGEYIWIDPEILKRVYDGLLEESGADILFHARVCGVDTDEEGQVRAVLNLLFACKDGSFRKGCADVVREALPTAAVMAAAISLNTWAQAQIGANNVPAAIQYPVVNAGMLWLMALAGRILYGEKFHGKTPAR